MISIHREAQSYLGISTTLFSVSALSLLKAISKSNQYLHKKSSSKKETFDDRKAHLISSLAWFSLSLVAGIGTYLTLKSFLNINRPPINHNPSVAYYKQFKDFELAFQDQVILRENLNNLCSAYLALAIQPPPKASVIQWAHQSINSISKLYEAFNVKLHKIKNSCQGAANQYSQKLLYPLAKGVVVNITQICGLTNFFHIQACDEIKKFDEIDQKLNFFDHKNKEHLEKLTGSEAKELCKQAFQIKNLPSE